MDVRVAFDKMKALRFFIPSLDAGLLTYITLSAFAGFCSILISFRRVYANRVLVNTDIILVILPK